MTRERGRGGNAISGMNLTLINSYGIGSPHRWRVSSQDFKSDLKGSWSIEDVEDYGISCLYRITAVTECPPIDKGRQ